MSPEESLATPPRSRSIPDLDPELRAIEAEIEAQRYRAGAWQAFTLRVRGLPDEKRLALVEPINRVSRKLHGRNGFKTLSLRAGITIELLAAAFGAALLVVGLAGGSNVAALTAAFVWITAFQPLLKVFAGSLLGIGYEYAYLRGLEPRFKMRYGEYLAAPRWSRVALHLSGVLGSPLAAWSVAALAAPRLPLTAAICTIAVWIILALNAAFFLAALAGARRLGVPLSATSGGAAALELRLTP